MKNYILAIDPSLTQTGMVLLDEKGKIIHKTVIKTNKEDGDERYFDIMHTIRAMVLLHEPKVFSIETQFYSFNVGSALKLAKLRGILIGMYKTLLFDGRVIEVSPMTAKSALGIKNGHFKKGKSKDAVRKAVLKIYPDMKDEEEDVIDSVSIGWAAYKIISKK